LGENVGAAWRSTGGSHHDPHATFGQPAGDLAPDVDAWLACHVHVDHPEGWVQVADDSGRFTSADPGERVLHRRGCHLGDSTVAGVDEEDADR